MQRSPTRFAKKSPPRPSTTLFGTDPEIEAPIDEPAGLPPVELPVDAWHSAGRRERLGRQHRLGPDGPGRSVRRDLCETADEHRHGAEAERIASDRRLAIKPAARPTMKGPLPQVGGVSSGAADQHF